MKIPKRDDSKTFSEDGFRKIRCRHIYKGEVCDRFLMETHVGQKTPVTRKCQQCKNVTTINPPEEATEGGQHGYRYDKDSIFTAVD